VTTGSNNLIIGYDITAPSATSSNQLSIGNLIYGTGINGTGTTLSTGSIGIGNNAPAVKLHVGSTAITDGTALIRLQDINSTCDFTANAGSPTCGSDKTLKKDIASIDNSLELINSLNPVTYHWKTENATDPLQSGFIAQEVQAVLPELVTDNTWIDGSIKKFLSTNGMMPYVVGAIKEQSDLIQSLSTLSQDQTDTINTIQSQLNTLQTQTNTLFDFYGAFQLGNIVMADANGNVDLINGKLKASNITADTLTISISDPTSPSIGTSTLYPIAEDTDNDGNDDSTGKPMTDPEVIARDGKSVVVKTGGVKSDSKVYITPIGSTGNQVPFIDSMKDGESFSVFVDKALSAPIQFNWWIVDQN
jgi:hypothetical protein